MGWERDRRLEKELGPNWTDKDLVKAIEATGPLTEYEKKVLADPLYPLKLFAEEEKKKAEEKKRG